MTRRFLSTLGPGAVVMAVYRPDPTLLERQVNSLRAQTVADWRCLVGIDGADPETRRVLLELIDGDSRFDVREYPDNVGVYRHFERLLADVPADAGWVALADQDDCWYVDKFARLLPLLAEDGVTAVMGQARLVDDGGRVLGVTDRRVGSMLDMLLRNQVTGSLAIFRRDVIATSIPFPQATDIAIHDHWLAVCSAGLGHVRLLDENVQDYVQHGRNVLGEVRPTPSRELIRRVHRSGGWAAHVNEVSTQVWGWRVAMARRGLELPLENSRRKGLLAVAQGGLTRPLLAVVLGRLRGRAISPRVAVGFSAAATWWPRSQGGPVAIRFE